MTTHRKRFENDYYVGRIGEGQIAQWARKVKNEILLPAYEIEYPTGKGPRLLLNGYELIAPDFYAIRIKGTTVLCKWIEAKHKTRFTWHFVSKNWQTGIDRRHYEDYLKVREVTQTMVYVMFLHRSDIPSKKDLANGSPNACPTGLYCRSTDYLRTHEDHRDKYERDGRDYPMVYWNEKILAPAIATLDDVDNATSSPSSDDKMSRDVDLDASYLDGIARADQQGYNHRGQPIQRDEELRKAVEKIYRARAMQGREENDD